MRFKICIIILVCIFGCKNQPRIVNDNKVASSDLIQEMVYEKIGCVFDVYSFNSSIHYNITAITLKEDCGATGNCNWLLYNNGIRIESVFSGSLEIASNHSMSNEIIFRSLVDSGYGHKTFYYKLKDEKISNVNQNQIDLTEIDFEKPRVLLNQEMKDELDKYFNLDFHDLNFDEDLELVISNDSEGIMIYSFLEDHCLQLGFFLGDSISIMQSSSNGYRDLKLVSEKEKEVCIKFDGNWYKN